jgi:Glucose-6-phosphate dehydrogenase, NAD binding domain
MNRELLRGNDPLALKSNREGTVMNSTQSDALVFFGATGDLAFKQIFPALQKMVRRGHLNVPVIGVAKSGWNLDKPGVLRPGRRGPPGGSSSNQAGPIRAEPQPRGSSTNGMAPS